jgi:hypothetical protein
MGVYPALAHDSSSIIPGMVTLASFDFKNPPAKHAKHFRQIAPMHVKHAWVTNQSSQ